MRAPAAEPRVGKYVKYDGGDYVIVTSRGAAQARRFMEDLVKFRLTLEVALGQSAAENTTPTTIVIAGKSDWNQWLRPREGLDGYFHSADFSNYMILDGDAPLEEARIDHVPRVHALLPGIAIRRRRSAVVQEGLADLMGSVTFEKGKAIVRILPGRLQDIRSHDWISFDRLIKVDRNDPEYQSHQLMPSFYAQSWLTVHYGTVENPEFGRQMVTYVNQMNMLVPQEEASKAAFGNDLSVVDKQLRDYSRSHNMHSGTMVLGEVPPMTFAEGKPLDTADTIAILVDAMLQIRLPPERTRPLVSSLESNDPNAARAAIWRRGSRRSPRTRRVSTRRSHEARRRWRPATGSNAASWAWRCSRGAWISRPCPCTRARIRNVTSAAR